MDRYDISQEEEQWAEMRTDPGGEWVRYEEAVLEVTRLTIERDVARRYTEQSLAELKAKAIEDAVQVVMKEGVIYTARDAGVVSHIKGRLLETANELRNQEVE